VSFGSYPPGERPVAKPASSSAITVMIVRGQTKYGGKRCLVTADQLGAMSPYLRGHISRFGAYATDDLKHQPEAFNPVLREVDFTALGLAA
jgi:hypothetical protein